MKKKRRDLTASKTPKGAYFDENTSDAIQMFLSSSNPSERDRIFAERIYPAFDKLAEGVLNKKRFYVLNQTRDELKASCVSWLYEKMGTFDPSRGKAFSYFTVVARNWFINESMKRAKRNSREVSIDSCNEDESFLFDMFRDDEIVEPTHEELMQRNDEIVETLHVMSSSMKSVLAKRLMSVVVDMFNEVKHDGSSLPMKSRAVFAFLREHAGLSMQEMKYAKQMIKHEWRDLQHELKCSGSLA